MNGKRAFLFATVSLLLAVLIGIEAGTAVVGILDYTLVRGKTRLVKRESLLGEINDERGSI